MNPHRHIPWCRTNRTLQACCPACCWDTKASVVPISFEERLTVPDKELLKDMLISF